MAGKFITLEGIEGVGKSTNVEFVARFLIEQGKSVVTTREPGGTQVGERLRDVLLNSAPGTVPHTSELLMMFAARAAHLEEVILPALARDTWVVCDRFTDATFAYQGGGRGLQDDVIEGLRSIVQGEFGPDLTILLDASVEVSEARRLERGQSDRFEIEQVEFFRRVRSKYLEIAKREPARVVTVDASRSLEEVQASLRSILEEILEK